MKTIRPFPLRRRRPRQSRRFEKLYFLAVLALQRDAEVQPPPETGKRMAGYHAKVLAQPAQPKARAGAQLGLVSPRVVRE
jgi:hypothetical protein